MKSETKWFNISFIISSEYRKKILKMLENPITPTKLSKELNINKTHVSRALKELTEQNLVNCLTPNAQKGKIFVISKEGKEILKEIKKLQN